ncbi:MAG: 23S rRNA (guanosine(2251)-2'-O)-methyltransferase RlmB [Microthrixaceae bacterium]
MSGSGSRGRRGAGEPGHRGERSGQGSRGGRSGQGPRRGGSDQGGRPAQGPRGDRDRQRPSSRGSARGRATSDRGLDGTQVEGRQSVRELLLAGTRRTREVLIAEELDPSPILADIAELARDLKVPVREISRRRHDAESRTESSQGVIARAAPLPDHGLATLIRTPRDGGAPFLLALDGITDPGNLGAMLRTAECAGVSGVLLPRHRSAHVSPTVTKTAAGAVEHVPMALVGGLPATIEQLRRSGVWVLGFDASGTRSLHEVAVGGQPVCIVVGAEGKGLGRLVRERCDELVSIPMLGALGSLNVATSAALAMYEVVRARSTARDGTA